MLLMTAMLSRHREEAEQLGLLPKNANKEEMRSSGWSLSSGDPAALLLCRVVYFLFGFGWLVSSCF